MKKTKLSSRYTVEDYESFRDAKTPNKNAIADLLYERFDERFIGPVLDVKAKKNGHGFAMMATACLAIEAFQSFVNGDVSDSHTGRVSAKLFESFFKGNPSFGLTGKRIGSFYCHVRNGLIHDAETRSGWRIVRTGPLFNKETKTINATKFIKELRKVIKEYSTSLHDIEWSDERWVKVINKFDSIVKRCEK